MKKMDALFPYDMGGKWPCSRCTFLNGPRVNRCFQCDLLKDTINYDGTYPDSGGSDILSASPTKLPAETVNRSFGDSLHESFQPLRISDFNGASQAISTPTPIGNNRPRGENKRSRVESRDICPIIPDRHGDDGWKFGSCDAAQRAESIFSGGQNPRNSNANTNTDKWSCSICTYLNWPRSMKCVMCMTNRGDYGAKDELNESVGVSGQGNNRSTSSDRDHSTSSIVGSPAGNNRTSVPNNSVTLANGVISNNRRTRELDARWLDACRGVVDGNVAAVEEFLAAGGDPSRQLTPSEVVILDRPSAFDIGFTLVHLALRFQQEHVLATLLSQVDGGPSVVKRVPSYVAPDLALGIRRHLLASLRQRKGSFHCHYTTEIVTFTLPSEIEDLPPRILETLFDEILDRDVMKELESGQIVNWSVELVQELNSRLYALWNRSAGDCLLDSVLQATWGIFDTDNGLRRALADSLHECATMFYQRWKENELLHATLLDFSLNDAQCATDWAKLLSIASKPGSSLEQLHIFALSHILRRPIIVYGVKYVKSFRGETLGFARYEGVYLPFLWEPAFCSKWPIALGYTRGHFSALVPIEPDCDPMPTNETAAQLSPEDISNRSVYLPLTSVDGTLLPIHFLSQSEMGKEEMILAQWLDVRFINSGVMVASQRIQKQPLLVAQMVEEWINHYRSLDEIAAAPYMRPAAATCYSSDGDSDND